MSQELGTAEGGAPPRWSALILAAVAVFVAVDIGTDAWVGSTFLHLALEIGIFGLASTGAALLWGRAERHRREAQRLRGDLSATQADLEHWRAEAHDALRGLGVAIERQCDRWKLSSAEREIALLLLKGLSLKEIAEVRKTAERTVRQQALAVYRKAGLSGRAELAAFFLEDLLLPAQGAAQGAAEGSS